MDRMNRIFRIESGAASGALFGLILKIMSILSIGFPVLIQVILCRDGFSAVLSAMLVVLI
jgi:hypothetical protein